MSIGSLGYHDDSTNQNVAFKKMNLSCFKLRCDYSYWIKLTNVHDFPARGRGWGANEQSLKRKTL